MKYLGASLLWVLAGVAAGQDGGQLFALNCAGCHGADGSGGAGGTAPPLANSAWVNGAAELPVKVVLHGLEGPVEVAGRTYNLAMPPQGGVLGDAQIAAVLSYVRSSWGNTGGVVTAELVKQVRAQTAARKQPWSSAELLKEHPLKVEPSALRKLTSKAFFGHFDRLPDFAALKAENIEEENDGRISVRHGLRKADFAILWEGEFEAPADGEYFFRVDSDDQSRVAIAGTTVVEILDIGPMGRAREGKIKLTRGAHPIRIEYVQGGGDMGISLGWKGPGNDKWNWLSEQTRSSSPWPNIPVQPVDGKLAIYRNFIAGTTPRAIGIGFPAGVDMAWSADHLAPELVWNGLFIDGGRHWIDRGVGDQEPAGEGVVRTSNAPAFAGAQEAASRWPEQPQLATRFRGYKLGKQADVTFSVEAGAARVLDQYSAAGPKVLVRTLRCEAGSGEPPAVLLVRGRGVKDAGAGSFTVDGGLTLTLKPAAKARVLDDGSLVVVLGKEPLEVRYSWR